MTRPSTSGPVESKVVAGTTGAAISTIVVWLLDTYAFEDIPNVVQGAIAVVVIALVTLASGYMAPHTPRTDSDAGTGPGL